MTFQAYIDNIQAKTGKSPSEFRVEAERKGLLGPNYTATKVIDWLKADYDLGRGHAMAIIKSFKDRGWIG
ncbi:MAG: DUF4287 domain-containing protein [Telluria sp.]